MEWFYFSVLTVIRWVHWYLKCGLWSNRINNTRELVKMQTLGPTAILADWETFRFREMLYIYTLGWVCSITMAKTEQFIQFPKCLRNSRAVFGAEQTSPHQVILHIDGSLQLCEPKVRLHGSDEREFTYKIHNKFNQALLCTPRINLKEGSNGHLAEGKTISPK